MNISPDITPVQRPQPSPRSPHARARPPRLNDLNAPTREESIDDNTKVPDYDDNLTSNGNIPLGRRGRSTRNTLSIIQKELEEAKRLIEAKVNSREHGENISASDKQSCDKTFLLRDTFDRTMRTSETEPKAPVISEQDEGSRPTTRCEKVYARYVQEGDRNLMLIYEPKETKSEIYTKQIGNKNVMVHLNISSNLCQLIDPVNKGIIPLDSEGEVWLEIKRRSQLRKEADVQTDDMSLADSVFEKCNLQNGQRPENEYVKHISHKCSYVEGKVGRPQPIEHDDVVGENEDEEPYEEPYETISITERGNSLMIKFEKWNHHGVIKSENLKDSPILSHEKVIHFLSDKGNDFDMNICDWEYEKDQSVYSYISSNLKLAEGMNCNDPYDKIITEQHRSPLTQVRELDEREASLSFVDPGYDIPIEDHAIKEDGSEEIYSKVIKDKDRHLDTKGNVLHRSVSDPAKSLQEHVKDTKQCVRSSDPQNYIKERKPDVPVRPPKRTINTGDLSQYAWYHGKIEKHVAKERLRGKEHGSFLVRESSKSKDAAHQFTIEFIDRDDVKKLMIMKSNNKYHFNEYEDKKFDRVEQLINTIMTSGLEVKDSRSTNWKNIKVKPVPRP